MMLDEDSATLATPIGPLTIIGTEKGIRSILFGDPPPSMPRARHESTLQCKAQLEEYFNGKRRTFDDLSLALVGTAFQTRVWEEVMKVPYGEVATYGSIAHSLRCAQSARAVGGAMGRNTLAIIIPCHRILPSGSAGMDRDSGEYAWGKDRKEWLLAYESKNQLPRLQKPLRLGSGQANNFVSHQEDILKLQTCSLEELFGDWHLVLGTFLRTIPG